MQLKLTEILFIKMFIEIDDLYIEYENYVSCRRLESGQKHTRLTRESAISPSEVASIVVAYQLSGYKNFEYYYRHNFEKGISSFFPKAPSYTRFVELITKACPLIYLWAVYKTKQAQENDIYIIDSKKLQVCHILRAANNKVFKDIASKGKSSTGWFYGLKLHLLINDIGEISRFSITPGNVADNNQQVLHHLLDGLIGTCIGDKGYLTKLFEYFYEQGLYLITKPKKNMRKLPADSGNIRLLYKRGAIESVNDILMTVCDIEHSRHRNPINAYAHICGALVAYQFIEDKPTIYSSSRNRVGRLYWAA
jgi:hypothetical protein